MPEHDPLSPPSGHTQALLATADGPEATFGQLVCLDLTPLGWARNGEPVPVSFGRGGFGWGHGEHPEALPRYPGAPLKREGDGRSPIGWYRLGTAFGDAPQPPPGCRMPYRQVTELDFWVDDPEAPDYNRWVTLPERADPAARWGSFERMRREDGQYRLGIVVEHNSAPVISGHGSAIFIHVWKGVEHPTEGCTAMPYDALCAILAWLDPARGPLLIQGPSPVPEQWPEGTERQANPSR